jgi:hypothetical protein
MTGKQPLAPNTRTLSMNSREFYEAVTEPRDPSLWAGCLPREPKSRNLEVIIEPRKRRR